MPKTIQIDDDGHARVEQVAQYFRMTQGGAASLLIRAATDERIRELAAEAAAGFKTPPAKPEAPAAAAARPEAPAAPAKVPGPGRSQAPAATAAKSPTSAAPATAADGGRHPRAGSPSRPS